MVTPYCCYSGLSCWWEVHRTWQAARPGSSPNPGASSADAIKRSPATPHGPASLRLGSALLLSAPTLSKRFRHTLCPARKARATRTAPSPNASLDCPSRPQVLQPLLTTWAVTHSDTSDQWARLLIRIALHPKSSLPRMVGVFSYQLLVTKELASIVHEKELAI